MKISNLVQHNNNNNNNKYPNAHEVEVILAHSIIVQTGLRKCHFTWKIIRYSRNTINGYSLILQEWWVSP